MIINWLKKIKRFCVQKAMLQYDVKKYSKYYTDSVINYDAKIFYEREIMVLCHTVEKGLSHNELKPLFGLDNVKKIVDYLKSYVELGEANDYIVSLAVSILEEYKEVNLLLGIDKEKLSFIPFYDKTMKLAIGADSINETEYFKNSQGTFAELLESRRSVRLYDTKSNPISIETLRETIQEALNCPSACNRQAVRVKIVTDAEKMARICNIQGGARGFGVNAGALLIVTSDVRYYMISERRLPMLDCGLFIMNLCYALYSKKLGSCILNGSMLKKQEQELNEIIKIPSHEMVAAILVISDVPENTKFKVAKSCKKDVDEIVTVL